MTTLNDILYTVNINQKVSVAVNYNKVADHGHNVIHQKTECFTGYPLDLLNYIDPGTLKHLASITGVENGIIQISSHPMENLNKYKAYYADAPVVIRKGTNIGDVEDIEAVNLNDALNQAQSYFGDGKRKLIGINLVKGIG